MGFFRRQPKPLHLTGVEEFDRGLIAAHDGPPTGTEDAASLSPADFAGVVAWMRQEYDRGHYDQVWARRMAFGYGVGESHMVPDDFFWFNAMGAMAALLVGQRDNAAVAMCAGTAEQAADRDDPLHVAFLQEINARYFA